jgi:hypothetical protein
VLFCFSNGLHAAHDCNRYLYSNTLTGSIPDSIGSAANLTVLCVLIDLAASSLLSVRVRAEGSRSGVSLLCRRFVFVRVSLFFFGRHLLSCAFDACVRALHTLRPKLLSGGIDGCGGGWGGGRVDVVCHFAFVTHALCWFCAVCRGSMTLTFESADDVSG